MAHLRYDKRSLAGDYLRGGAGLAVTGIPLLLTPMIGTFQTIIGIVALLFAGFILRTWLRSRASIELSDEAILQHGPIRGGVRWAGLSQLDLRYYSTRRDKQQGWMQLTLKDRDGGKIVLESTLEDFQAVLVRAAEAAGRNGLALSQATAENLAAAGVRPAFSD